MRGICPTLVILTLLGTARPILAQSKSPARISCRMQHSPVIVIDRKDGLTTSHEEDDWRVDCTIEFDGKTIFASPLPLVHPAKIDEALGAFEEFRKKKAGEIVAEYEKGKKQ